MPKQPRVRTPLPSGREVPRFAGVATFCRFPLIDSVAAEQQPVDWAVYGVPFDGGVTFHPGARFGPRAIREASQYIKPVHLELGVHLGEVFSLADAGDAPVRPYSCKQTLDAACEFATRIGTPAHTRLLAIGGDHSIAYANLAATWQRLGKPGDGLALLHLDAHLDTVDAVWGEKWGHASPFRRAIEEKIVDPTRMLSIGIRGPGNDPADIEQARGLGIEVVTAEACRGGQVDARLEAFCKRVGEAPLYLSFDIDCVDPAYAPGTGTPVCGGLSSAEAFALVRGVAGMNLVGADVVEVLPARDPVGITALLASHVIFEILAVAAARQAAPSPA